MDKLTKIGFWWLGPVKDWQTRLHGFEIRSGVGDLISNNVKRIRLTEDRSEWAYECLDVCFDLLKNDKRWDDDLNDLIPPVLQCKSRVETFLYKFKFHLWKRINKRRVKKGKEEKQIFCKYRWQGDMTRDPYIQAIATTVHLDKLDPISEVSIPWYLYKPTTWRWHRYLKKPTARNYRRWDRAEKVSALFSNVPEFASGLRATRREIVEIIKNKIENE